MPGGLDVLVELQVQANEASIQEVTNSFAKESNVVKELTTALEKQNKAQKEGGITAAAAAAEQKKYEEALKNSQNTSNNLAKTLVGLQSDLASVNTELKNSKKDFDAGKISAEKFLRQQSDLTKQQVLLKAQITDTTKEFQKSLGINEKTEKSVSSLRAQLRLMREELAALEISGQTNTARFRELSIQAGELNDQIGDTSQRIAVLASDTKYIDATIQGISALAGAFAAGQAAVALFGDENKDLQLVIQKVMGALALLNGVQTVANALNKDSALRILVIDGLLKRQAASTTATAVATEGLAAAEGTATVATTGLTAAIAANPLGAIAVALTAVIGLLFAFSGGEDDAADSTGGLNDALEYQNQLLDDNQRNLKRATDLATAKAKAEGRSASEVAAIQRASLEQEKKTAQEREDLAFFAFSDAIVKVNKANTEENRKARDEAKKTLNERTEQVKDAANAISVFDQEQIAERNKRNEDAGKKALEQAEKTRDQLLKIQQQLEQERINAIDIARNRELAQERFATDTRIAELNRETGLTKEGLESRAKLIQQIEENSRKKLGDIDKKYDEIDRQQRGEQLKLTTQFRSNASPDIAAAEQAGINFGASLQGVKERKPTIDRVNEEIKYYDQQIQLIGGALNAFLSAEQAKTDGLIAEQEKRVAATKEAAEKGNTAIYNAEVERLSRLQAQREENAEKQMALNTLLVASQQAVNLAEAIGAVVSAAAQGDPYTIALRVAAAVAALVAGIASITAATKTEYAEGGYTGVGGKYEEAGTVHKGEYVMSQRTVQKYGMQMMEDIHTGRFPNYAGMLQSHNETRQQTYDYRRMESLLQQIATKDASVTKTIFDENGLTQTYEANKQSQFMMRKLRRYG